MDKKIKEQPVPQHAVTEEEQDAIDTLMTEKQAMDQLLEIVAKSKKQIAQGMYYTREESLARRIAQREEFLRTRK